MKILHIDSSILGTGSVSRALSEEIVAKLCEIYPNSMVIRRDLVNDAVQHLGPDHLAVFQGATPHTTELGQDIALGGTYIEELLTTDLIVIGAPMYNFTVPTQLKGWLDRVIVAGQTFSYTENGPQSLLSAGKKVYLASARGGFYSGTSPLASLDHQESYLLTALNFIGLGDVTIIRAEGIGSGEEVKKAAVEKARAEISLLKA